MELGIYTFADVNPTPEPGQRGKEGAERLANLIEAITLADEIGLDVFGVGEHHRADYAVSAPAVALAAAAMRTKNIRLTSAVTVLSSDDPVRVFQQFSTLDLLSNGRAEIMAGRGSFIESFPLFGYALDDYDQLFSEKLDLLLNLQANETVSWSGEMRAPIAGRPVYPQPLQNPLPIWIAVGGTPASVARAGALGLPLAIAIIGGEPARFAPLFDLYREAARRAGTDPAKLKTSIDVHGFVADTTELAFDTHFGPSSAVMNRIGRERGWGPTSRAQYERSGSPDGALFIGDPDKVADKIIRHHGIFKNDRFLLQMDTGVMPHKDLMRSIELYGTKVAPKVRAAVGV